MKRLILALFTLAAISTSVYAQTTQQQITQSKCKFTEANSLDVRGVRLGMSTEQVFALFPGSSKRDEIKTALDAAKSPAGNQITYLYFIPATYPNRDQFAQVDSISVTLYKGRVVEFTIAYIGPVWRNIDEWIAKLSEAFGLPGAQEWVTGPEENPNKSLRCNGIEISAAMQGGSASMKLSNPGYLKEAQERINAEQEKKRREFKP